MAHKSNGAIIFVLVCYFAVGWLFAITVPAWQTPDEPAHYNYTRQLAQTGQFPVIAMGDYDQILISTSIAPPNAKPNITLDVAKRDAVQYEDHQPPLFYMLSAPLFLATNGWLVALRLCSLALGGVTVLFAYLIALKLFPDQHALALFAAIVVAFVPQHLHIMAGYNNDSLSEALLAIVLWLCVGLIVDRSPQRWRDDFLLGALVGLSLLTKPQAYLALPLAACALLLRQWGKYLSQPNQKLARHVMPALVRPICPTLLLGVMLGLPWWLRNIQIYGGLDALGLQRHNLVVVGQLTTAERIQQLGLMGWVYELLRTTFQSFWGQFGWMSIPLNDRQYVGFLILTALSTLLFFAQWRYLRALPRETQHALTLLAALGLMSVLAFMWYNLQFVQYQGRYLYPALIPLAIAFAIGWQSAVSRITFLRAWLWLPVLAVFVALNVYLLYRVIAPAMQI